ncbi:MAG: hypothetical protein HUJ57_01385 [Erysipelotrichaceae bacterium]|nr:hypothetical protein [Erysipelotrichaceae bacterium]
MIAAVGIIIISFIAYMMINKNNPGNARIRLNNALIRATEKIEDPLFFSEIDEFIDTCDSEEFRIKGRTVKCWGLARNKMFDTFEEELAKIDLTNMKELDKNGNLLNEDTFFYLGVGIPNSLYAGGRIDLVEKVWEKLQPHYEELKQHMVIGIANANHDFYTNNGDRGQAFYEMIIEGDYEGYLYLKQLIGLYKQMVSAMYYRLMLDQDCQDNEKLHNLKVDCQQTAKTLFGRHYLRELDLMYTGDDEKEEETEEE